MNYVFATFSTLPRHYFLFTTDPPGNSYLYPEVDTIPLNTWSHWTLTRRGSFMGVYRNGILIQSREDEAGDPLASTEPIELAKYGGTYTPCMVDRARVYRRGLTEDEIKAISGRDAYIREGLALCLDFTEYEGNTVQDQGPYGFIGTIYGGSSWVIKRAVRVLQA